jgi:hypothetical protein
MSHTGEQGTPITTVEAAAVRNLILAMQTGPLAQSGFEKRSDWEWFVQNAFNRPFKRRHCLTIHGNWELVWAPYHHSD